MLLVAAFSVFAVGYSHGDRLLDAVAPWLVCGWSTALIRLPWMRIWREPNPRLTIFALLRWGAVHGIFGVSILSRGTAQSWVAPTHFTNPLRSGRGLRPAASLIC